MIDIGFAWLVAALAGVVAAVLVLAISRSRFRWPMSIGAAVAANTIALYLFGPPPMLGVESWWQRSPGREVVVSGAMYWGVIVGLLSSSLHDWRTRVGEWSGSGRKGPKPSVQADLVEVVVVLVIASSLLMGLWGFSRTGCSMSEHVFLSFQTGFFCESIAMSVRGR